MTKLFLILALVVLSALFSSCETSFSSVNKIRLKHYAAQGNRRAARALGIANAFDNALTAILIGNNVVNILSASLATVLFTEWFGDGGVGISTVIMTIVVLIFGEILPKSYAKAHAEACALWFAAPLSGLIWVMTPLVFLFQKMASLLKSKEEQPSVTEDELKYIIEEIEEQGVLEEEESDLVRSALEFDEIMVSQVLIPRVNVIAVEQTASIDSIKETFFTEMYSRLPVYDKSIDNIIGVITSKDFFKMLDAGGQDISGILQEVMHVSELMHISEALQEMQRKKSHMAVVMDQYGGTEGILTMEDIIEELVGEIYDENDEVVSTLTKTGQDEYEVSGELSVNDLCEQLGLPDEAIESTGISVGGWVMELFGTIPKEKDTITSGRFEITVLRVQEQKILSIRLCVHEQTEPTEEREEA